VQHYAEDGSEKTRAMLCGRYVLHRDEAAPDGRAKVEGEGVVVSSTHQLLLFAIERSDGEGNLEFCPALIKRWADFTRLSLGPGWATFSAIFRDGLFEFVPKQSGAADVFFATLARLSLCARKPLSLTDANLCGQYVSAIEESEELASEQILVRNGSGGKGGGLVAGGGGRKRSVAGPASLRDLSDCSAARERAMKEERALGIHFLASLEGEEPPLSPFGPTVLYGPATQRAASEARGGARDLCVALCTVISGTFAVFQQRHVPDGGGTDVLLLWAASIDELQSLHLSLSTPCSLALCWSEDENESEDGDSDDGSQSHGSHEDGAGGKGITRLHFTDAKHVAELAKALNEAYFERLVVG
jgi:hypothetical protein